MFKNQYLGRCNICGLNVRKIREQRGLSQADVAVLLQNNNHDVGKNAVQEMESGVRSVSDIELEALSRALKVSIEELLDKEIYKGYIPKSESEMESKKIVYRQHERTERVAEKKPELKITKKI